ncbi:MAG: HEPN domain-containing protein [Egibacteraceae bacterium]
MSEPLKQAKDQAQVWLRFAQEDLVAGRRAIEDEEIVIRIAGFLAQQSAEKALKAILVAHGIGVPKIHDLFALADDLPVPTDELDRGDFALLNPWITAGRYPGNLPDCGRDEAEELCLAAERILVVAERLVAEAASG